MKIKIEDFFKCFCRVFVVIEIIFIICVNFVFFLGIFFVEDSVRKIVLVKNSKIKIDRIFLGKIVRVLNFIKIKV